MPNKNRSFEQLINRSVKLVIQEPGQRVHTIYGRLLGIGNGLIVFESKHGIGSYNLKYVVAIKPREGRE